MEYSPKYWLPWEKDEDEAMREGRSSEAVEAEPSEPKQKKMRVEEPRSSAEREKLIARRLGKIVIGEEEFHHLDEMVTEEKLTTWEEDEQEERMLAAGEIRTLEWRAFDKRATSTPGQPLPEIDRVAEQVEERRLQSLEVLRDLQPEEEHFGLLTSICPWLAYQARERLKR